MADFITELFGDLWGSNPLFSTVVVGLIVVPVIAGVVSAFRSDSDETHEFTPEEWEKWDAERKREREEEEREREEQKRINDLETAAFILAMEAEHQDKLSRAICGRCLHKGTRTDEEGNTIYICPQYGEITEEEGDRPHYCEYYDTFGL